MSSAAVVTMILGMVIVWGSLVASIVNAVRSHRSSTRDDAGAERPEPGS